MLVQVLSVPGLRECEIRNSASDGGRELEWHGSELADCHGSLMLGVLTAPLIAVFITANLFPISGLVLCASVPRCT